MRNYIDLHVCSKGSYEEHFNHEIGLLAKELMWFLDNTGTGKFTGEEFHSGEAILFFESQTLPKTLTGVRAMLERLDLLRDAFVIIREGIATGKSDVRIQMEDLDVSLKRLRRRTPAKQWTKRRRPKVHDYYAIPLPDGRYGYVRHLYHDPTWNDIVQVLSLITTDQSATLEQLVGAEQMFPPVLTSVAAAVRVGGWIFLGNHPFSGFEFPTFRGTNSLLLRRYEPGVYDDWWLWSGGDIWKFVGRLDDEQRRLEYKVWWAPQNLAKRIATGENEYGRFL